MARIGYLVRNDRKMDVAILDFGLPILDFYIETKFTLRFSQSLT